MYGLLRVEERAIETFYNIMALLDYQDFNANSKVNHFSKEKSQSSRELLLPCLVEEVKLVVVERNEFENVKVILDKILGIFGKAQVGSNDKRTEGSVVVLQQELHKKRQPGPLIFQ